MRRSTKIVPSRPNSRSVRGGLSTLTLAALLSLPGVHLNLLPELQSAPQAATPATAADRYRYGDPEARRIKLDALFAQLKVVKSGFVARSIIEQIWLTWHQSGRSDIDDLLSRAKINVSEGEYEAAIEKFNRIIKQAPDFAEAWNGRATLFFHMGRYEESLADIEETLKREPRHFGTLAGRGRILALMGNDKAALAALNEAIRHNPFISERHTILPAIRRRLGIRDL